MQIIAEAGGDDEVEFHFPCLVPGEVADTVLPDVLLDAVGEDGTAGLGAVELDAGVVERREDVGDAGGGGDAVDHQEYTQCGVDGSPLGGQGEDMVGCAGRLLGGHKSQSLLGVSPLRQRVGYVRSLRCRSWRCPPQCPWPSAPRSRVIQGVPGLDLVGRPTIW
ncbi:hypothetical protein GCM10027590_34580 [Nocardiopsis nanhaiensis]